MKQLFKILIILIFSLMFIPSARAEWEFGESRQCFHRYNPTSSDLTDFPMNIELDTANYITLGLMRSDCLDLWFYDNKTDTALNWSWPNYNSGSFGCDASNSQFWIRVPNLEADNSTYICAYFGNASHSTFNNNSEGVWIDNYKLVLHLDEGTGTIIRDSTSNDNDGVTLGSPAWVSGEFGGALNFSRRIGQIANVSDSDSLDITGPISLVTWVNLARLPSDYNDYPAIIGKAPNSGAEGYQHWFYNDNDYSMIFGGGAGLGRDNEGTLVTGDKSNWRQFVSTFNGSHIALYKNATLVEVDPETDSPTATTVDLLLAMTNDGYPARKLDASLDEVRVYSGALSQDWITNTFRHDLYSLSGLEQASASNVVITITPATLYTDTDINCSVLYNHTNGSVTDLTINLTVNGVLNESETWIGIASGSTHSIAITSDNYEKYDNVTCSANITDGTTDTETKMVQNSPPTTPTLSHSPHSVMTLDLLTTTGFSTDIDNESITYYYQFANINGTVYQSYSTNGSYAIPGNLAGDTLNISCRASDGEDNSTLGLDTMAIVEINITVPVPDGEYIGKGLSYIFNFTVQNNLTCYEYIDLTQYSLGNITGGIQNNTRETWYGNHSYNVTCTSWYDDHNYTKNVSHFFNSFANWSVVLYNENNWTEPFDTSLPNATSLIIYCTGGPEYTHYFANDSYTLENIRPLCDVITLMAKVDYGTDSYTRERLVPDSLSGEVPIYMVDAYTFTLLQTPIYMSDGQYYNARLTLYKTSGGTEYIIADGWFDIEHKYVTYLIKDNRYYIRITQGTEIRDMGYLYSATATAQYLSVSQLSLVPDISLISDNLQMTAEFVGNSVVVRYVDLTNMTNSVRIRIFEDVNQTALFDNTYSSGTMNLTVTINDLNASRRYSVHFSVNHQVYGNSPVQFSIGVGTLGTLFNLGISSWIYGVISFALALFTSFVINPKNKIPGIIFMMVLFIILGIVGWATLQNSVWVLAFVFLVLGLLYNIKIRGGSI